MIQAMPSAGLHLRTAFCAALGLLAALPAAMAAARVELTVQARHTPRSAGSKVPPDTLRKLDVTLAGSYIAVASGQETTIYDLRTRRRIVVDMAAHRYVDYSLYDVPGFRSAELANRRALAGAMAKAGIQAPVPDALAEEHLLSVAREGQAGPVAAADGAGWSDASGKPMARRGAELLDAAPEDVRAYARLLRYTVGGHPKILAALAAGKGIPKQLVFNFSQSWGDSTQTVTVKSVQPLVQAPAYDLAGFKPGHSGGRQDALDEALDRAAVLDTAAIEARRRRVRGEMEEAWQGGRAFQAYLGLMEVHLMSGAPIERLPQQQLDLVRADASVARLGQLMAAKTKEQYAQVVPLFAQLHEAAGPKAHVLKIFEANDRVQIGDLDTAARLFAEVLRANPALAGVYKDLGDLLFLRYDTPRAWLSWDAGRRMAPDFDNFRKIGEYERRLAQDFPEYF